VWLLGPVDLAFQDYWVFPGGEFVDCREDPQVSRRSQVDGGL